MAGRRPSFDGLLGQGRAAAWAAEEPSGTRTRCPMATNCERYEMRILVTLAGVLLTGFRSLQSANELSHLPLIAYRVLQEAPGLR
jgi:hypothetical protein